MVSAPLRLRYEGEGDFRVVSNYWAAKADQEFVVGEVYAMVEHHDRSANSHRHYFAVIADAWRTMPDMMLEQYPTSEHLRKKALVWKGYRDERTIVAASQAEAERVAAFIKPMDDFAVVTVRDAVVRVWTAKSQSVKAMGAKEFQQSKTDVLEFISEILGTTRDELSKVGGMAA